MHVLQLKDIHTQGEDLGEKLRPFLQKLLDERGVARTSDDCVYRFFLAANPPKVRATGTDRVDSSKMYELADQCLDISSLVTDADEANYLVRHSLEFLEIPVDRQLLQTYFLSGKAPLILESGTLPKTYRFSFDKLRPTNTTWGHNGWSFLGFQAQGWLDDRIAPSEYPRPDAFIVYNPEPLDRVFQLSPSFLTYIHHGAYVFRSGPSPEAVLAVVKR